MKEALEGGYDSCLELGRVKIFQWLGKIFFGILRKELTLLLDRSDPEVGTIVPPDLLEELRTLHAFLQSIRRPLEFTGQVPFSVLVANLHDVGVPDNFSFRDSLHLGVVALRTREVGFVVVIQDGGVNQATHGQYLTDVAGEKLHPIQFDELYAKVLYQTSRLNRTPKYVTMIPKDIGQAASVMMLPLQGFSEKPILDEWVQAEYAQCFRLVMQEWLDRLGIEPESTFEPPNRVMSFQTERDGRLVFMNREGGPFWEETI